MVNLVIVLAILKAAVLVLIVGAVVLVLIVEEVWGMLAGAVHRFEVVEDRKSVV